MKRGPPVVVAHVQVDVLQPPALEGADVAGGRREEDLRVDRIMRLFLYLCPINQERVENTAVRASLIPV